LHAIFITYNLISFALPNLGKRAHLSLFHLVKELFRLRGGILPLPLFMSTLKTSFF